MKNRFSKILGIVLAVTVMAGLLMIISPASPVSAGPLAWTNVNIPNNVNFQLVDATLNTYVIAPDGKTIFAYGTGTDTASPYKKLFKSTDGGITFVTAGLGSGLNGAAVIGLALTQTYATDLTVVAITSNMVYRSTDGGANFTTVSGVGGVPLTSVAVTNNYYNGGQAILVGYAGFSGTTPIGGVSIYTGGGWTDLTSNSGSNSAPSVSTPTTTMSVSTNASAGSTSLNVTSASGFPAAPFSLFVGGTNPEIVNVSAVTGTIFTVSALANTHTTGTSGDQVIANVTGYSKLSSTANVNNGTLSIVSTNQFGSIGATGVAVVGLGLGTAQAFNYQVSSPTDLALLQNQVITAQHNVGEIVGVVTPSAVSSAGSVYWNQIKLDGSTVSATGPFNVYAVAFSPTYTADNGIIVVCSNNSVDTSVTPNVIRGHSYLRYKLSNLNWDTSVLPAQIDGTQYICPATPNLMADLAFPSDFGMFAPANVVYVSLGGASTTTNPGMNVYRVNASSLGGSSQSYILNVTGSGNTFSAGSVAFVGPAATGTLVTGSAASGATIIYSTTTSYTSSPTWTQAPTPPSGGGPVTLTFSPTSTVSNYTLFAGTKTSAGNTVTDQHGGLFTSTDAAHFTGLSLLNVTSLSTVSISGYSLSAPKAWIFVRDWVAGGPKAGDNTMLFYSTDSGNTWVEIYSHVSTVSGTTSGVDTYSAYKLNGYDYPSQLLRSPSYATDNTMFLRFNIPQIWKSTDNGLTWYGSSTPNGLIITTMSLIDVNTYWIAAANGTGIYKSGYTTGVNLNGEVPTSIVVRPGGTEMWVTTYSGSIWRSIDSGATYSNFGPANFFKDLSGANQGPGLSFDPAYATNKTIYSAAANHVYRWVVDTNVTWDEITPSNGLYNTYVPTGSTTSISYAVPINAITVSADGTLYLNTTGANGAAIYNPYYRNVKPTDILSDVTKVENWQAMPTSGFVGAVGPGPISLQNTSVQNAASNTIYASVSSITSNSGNALPANATVTTSQNGFARQVLTFQDTLVQAPVIRAPAAKAQVQTPVTLSWTALPNVGGQSVTYQIKVATDAQFGGLIVGPGLGGNVEGTTPGTSYFIPANLLNPGTTYYWSVAASVPMNSKLSQSNFSVVLAQGGDTLLSNGLFSPAIGATNVTQKPVFQWAAIAGAVSYNFQVADNPVFVNPVDAQTNLNTTVWTETKALDYGKIYYWRVQAVSAAGVASDWANSSFTVMNQPVSGAPTSGQVVVPTITFNVPTQPVPTINIPSYPTPTYTFNVPAQTSTTSSTPASIWVLIAIGAVLIIAVIVLIARTRRV